MESMPLRLIFLRGTQGWPALQPLPFCVLKLLGPHPIYLLLKSSRAPFPQAIPGAQSAPTGILSSSQYERPPGLPPAQPDPVSGPGLQDLVPLLTWLDQEPEITCWLSCVLGTQADPSGLIFLSISQVGLRGL